MSGRMWFITGASRGFGRSFTRAALSVGDRPPRRSWASRYQSRLEGFRAGERVARGADDR